MTQQIPLAEFLADMRLQIEAALPEIFEPPVEHERWLEDAMLYSLMAPGKRVRPVLALHTTLLLGGPAENILPAACALEMIHTFSLIHDDLPAMDDDDLRRGQPANHIQFGEGLAVLAGDGLLCRAFEHVAQTTPDLALAGRLGAELASGTMAMIRGQVADLNWEGRNAPAEALESIHRQKTAALFRTALRLGALAARASEDFLDRLSTYGESIGLAFQIADDLLDVESTTEEMGKEVGKDAARGKNTYPGLFGPEASRERAEQLIEEALAAIAPIPGTERLAELARYILERTS